MSARARYAPWFRSGQLRWDIGGPAVIQATVGFYLGVQVWIGSHHERFDVEVWDRSMKWTPQLGLFGEVAGWPMQSTRKL